MKTLKIIRDKNASSPASYFSNQSELLPLLARSDFSGVDKRRKLIKNFPVVVKLNDRTIISPADDKKSASGFSFGLESRDL